MSGKLELIHTGYHGVFAPASPGRARNACCCKKPNESGEVSSSGRQRALTWAQRLKGVFAIDIETCGLCGGKLRVIASIEDPPLGALRCIALIERILGHLDCAGEPADPAHPSRAPPQGDFLLLAPRDPRDRPRHGVGRAGFSLRRDAPAFVDERGRFMCPDDGGSGRAVSIVGLICPQRFGFKLTGATAPLT